ncbi:gluconokinase [Pontibacillus salicampi]|uniref:Gluconokinase n=1 Tax=Pontibacillus salicampi TaxID=1449801 RepID=A0ABV6LQ32_9BACI
MKTDIILAIDIGTTSTKTLGYDKEGTIWAEVEEEYPLYSPEPSRKEQDPEEIYQAVTNTVKAVATEVTTKGGAISGVGFSAAMHSILAVDQDGKPLTMALTWADQRSIKEVEELQSGNGHEIYLRTGTPLHPMSPLSKLMWMNRNEPELFQAVYKWISIKEYVFYRLFHRYIVDYSIASATGLFNLEALDWDEEALDVAGISKEKLSEPVPTTHVLTELSSAKGEELGLEAGTPFILGASDGVLANIGVGALHPGSVACTIGTSGAIRTVVDKPTVDPKGRIFCYALTEDKWVIGGPINNGGISFRWVRDNLFPDIDKEAAVNGVSAYEELTTRAANIQPGSNGLLFLPYLTGERAPFWDSDTKGVFFGLTLDHNRNHMIRSVLEGVMFQMYSVAIALIEAGVEPVEFRAGGGFAKSDVWRQIMADMFETELVIPESHQGSCLGAAWLTMKALNMIEDLSSVNDIIHTKVKHSPIPENVTIYRKLKPIYLRLARKLPAEFKAISEVQRDLAKQ